MEMIITKDDVQNLNGKFIIQLTRPTETSPEQHTTINNENWGFLKEKRISFVCGLKWSGFYYEHRSFETTDEFAEYWNNYYQGKRDRYHRLLTSKEIDFVCAKMKQENF